MHEGSTKEEDSYHPQNWMITAVWLSKYTRCLRYVEICPEKAKTVSWQKRRKMRKLLGFQIFI
jgi:hypothetical protein